MQYNIVTYPNKQLKQTSKSIDKVDDTVSEIAKLMIEIMQKNNGIGLAAPQIGIQKRLIIVDEKAIGNQNSILVMVNPQIIRYESFYEEHEEGCLSVPGFYGKVLDRRKYIKLKYLNLDESEQILEFDNFLSVVVQHETDHLNGILFIDRINFVEKLRFKKFLKEQK